MRSRKRAQIVAVLGATAIFAILLFGLRLRGYLPFVVGVFAYLALLVTFLPRRRKERPVELPDGVDRAEFERTISDLDSGARKLRTFKVEVPPADEPLFEHMADLLDRIREHHLANPSHARRTRTFVRHGLRRIIDAVGDYAALVRRANDGQKDRLAEISRNIENFVPILEKIDQACVENDLMALEINIEVLNDQLDRKG